MTVAVNACADADAYHPAFRRYTCGSLVLLGRVTCPPLKSGFNLVGSSL
jgi:hypothetical protein